MSDHDTQLKIREIAYCLWQQEGEPAGREDEFWHRAKSHLEGPKPKPDPDTADSFPASDPPSNSGIIGPKIDK